MPLGHIFDQAKTYSPACLARISSVALEIFENFLLASLGNGIARVMNGQCQTTIFLLRLDHDDAAVAIFLGIAGEVLQCAPQSVLTPVSADRLASHLEFPDSPLVEFLRDRARQRLHVELLDMQGLARMRDTA